MVGWVMWRRRVMSTSSGWPPIAPFAVAVGGVLASAAHASVMPAMRVLGASVDGDHLAPGVIARRTTSRHHPRDPHCQAMKPAAGGIRRSKHVLGAAAGSRHASAATTRWPALKDRAAATLPPRGSHHQTSCRRPRSQPQGRGPSKAGRPRAQHPHRQPRARATRAAVLAVSTPDPALEAGSLHK